MRKEWMLVKFEMKPYLDTPYFVVSSLPQVIDRLEENIARTLVIAGSPYTKYIEKYQDNNKVI